MEGIYLMLKAELDYKLMANQLVDLRKCKLTAEEKGLLIKQFKDANKLGHRKVAKALNRSKTWVHDTLMYAQAEPDLLELSGEEGKTKIHNALRKGIRTKSEYLAQDINTLNEDLIRCKRILQIHILNPKGDKDSLDLVIELETFLRQMKTKLNLKRQR